MPMKICPQCQHTLADEDRFCSTCGYEFIDGEDPYSESSVHPVNLPGEEYRDEEYFEPEVQRTVVAPMRAARKPGYVQARDPQYVPRKKSSPVLNGILIAISLLLILAIFGVLYMIFSSSNPLESALRSNSISGPSILQSNAPKAQEQELVSQAPQTKEAEKKEEQPDKSATLEGKEELKQIYKEISKQADSVSSSIKAFDASHTKSLEERQGERALVQDKIAELNELKKSVEDTKVSKELASNKKEQEKLIDLTIERLKVLDRAYEISLEYPDASEHKDEVLKPFRNAYREGTSRSKYLLEYEEMYPKANPDK